MTRAVAGALALLGAALVARGEAAPPAPRAAVVVRDMRGREVRLAAPPARIVSLVPSATEILFALGAEDRLVGVTRFCDYPPAVRAKPSVGDMLAPSLETIVALRPDLVIVTDEGNREETFGELRRLGLPIFLVRAHRLADVAAVVEGLAALTGREDAARRLVARMDDRVRAVRRAVAPYPRPRVLYVVWPEPLIVPGRPAIVTELIQVAGGDSITAGEGTDYPRFSVEAAVARNPDVIVLASHSAGTPPGAREKFERLGSVAAVRANRVHAVDGDLLHRYTPRVVDGLEQLARVIHPEAFR